MPKITKSPNVMGKGYPSKNKTFSGNDSKKKPPVDENKFKKKEKPYGMKEGGKVKNKKSMNDQFFDAIDRRRAKKIFDVRKRIDERVEKQQLEGLRKTGHK